ncbi:acyl-CoA thioesterase [Trichloromonas sp.]|uniref:acyl-CoA thioesterase n=1 Tax=Trichloromonas sp. TaxID=3069249 RepID=UPI003D819337
MIDYDARLDFQVRDYECDMQGVVNNAVYQNYLEHARHEFIKTLGVDFADLARQKINLVVVRAELDYKTPLVSSDRFWIGTRLEKLTPLRFVFFQDIYRTADQALVVKARIIGTALNERGRPKMPAEIARALTPKAAVSVE